MSVALLKIISFSVRQHVKRFPIQTGILRTITAMDTLSEDTKQPDTKEPDTKNNMFYDKRNTRFRKRQWVDYEKKDGDSDNKKSCEDTTERIKKKKMALLLGYCGADYYGMQRNPGVPTIEEDLLKALFEAKYITEEDFKNQQNAQFQRSSRTDKGVSAARQVVSLKLPLETKIEEINSRLPPCIRVFGIKRVTNKFNSKGKCNARTYSYTLPTYVFEPSLSTMEERKKYRISSEKLEKVQSILSVYKGTKSYHNFTEKKHYQDPSASRYMMSFGVEKVFVDCDMEFAVLLVKGQSFMLHQIRKMVGLMIAVVRQHVSLDILDKAFGRDKVMMPTAPGLGLVLDMVHYDRYDAKHRDSHDSLAWDDLEDTVQKFKHEHIYPVIVKGELEDHNMCLWLNKVKNHTYEPSDDKEQDADSEEAGGSQEKGSNAENDGDTVNDSKNDSDTVNDSKNDSDTVNDSEKKAELEVVDVKSNDSVEVKV